MRASAGVAAQGRVRACSAESALARVGCGTPEMRSHTRPRPRSTSASRRSCSYGRAQFPARTAARIQRRLHQLGRYFEEHDELADRQPVLSACYRAATTGQQVGSPMIRRSGLSGRPSFARPGSRMAAISQRQLPRSPGSSMCLLRQQSQEQRSPRAGERVGLGSDAHRAIVHAAKLVQPDFHGQKRLHRGRVLVCDRQLHPREGIELVRDHRFAGLRREHFVRHDCDGGE
jgi:hypothetical protein